MAEWIQANGRCSAIAGQVVACVLVVAIISMSTGGCPVDAAGDYQQDNIIAGLTDDEPTDDAPDNPDELPTATDEMSGSTSNEPGISAAEVALITPKGVPARVLLESRSLTPQRVNFVIVSPPATGALSEVRPIGPNVAEVYYIPPDDFVGRAQFSYAALLGEQRSDPATVQIVVYPELRFAVEPTEGPPGLTVRAWAYTVGDEPLPNGTLIWSFDDEREAGPVQTHAELWHTFHSPGIHLIRLSLVLLGTTLEVSCSTRPGVLADHAAVSVGVHISGRILDQAARPIRGVRLTVSGAGVTTSDADGYYHIGAPYDWSGSITPSHPGYVFDPPYRQYRAVKTDIGNAGFVGAQAASNQPPQAHVQNVDTDEDREVVVKLIGSDPENDPLTYVIAEGPAHGQLRDAASGQTITNDQLPYTLKWGDCRIIYKPAPEWNGADSFSFFVRDAAAASQPAVVTVRVSAVNDGPRLEIVCPFASFVEMDSLLSSPANQVTLVAIDPDAGPAELVWSIADSPRGTVLIKGSPSGSGEPVTLSYEPPPGYAGLDEATIVVQDAFNAEFACRWQIQVGGFNIAGTIRGYDGLPRAHTALVFIGSGAYQGVDYTAISGPDGTYSQRVPLGWCGRVTADADHRFEPAERDYQNVVAPVTGADFVALRNYYVAPDGSDQSPGTFTAPFRTLQHAVDVADPGDTIIARAGVYDSGSSAATVPVLLIQSPAGGVAGYPLTIRAAVGQQVIFDGRAGTTRELVQIKASYVNLEGLELTGARRTAVAVIYAGDTTEHVNIRLCHAHHNNYDPSWIGGAFRTVGPVRYVTFEDCISHDNSIGFELREDPPQTAATAQVPPVAGNSGFPQGLPEAEWDTWPGWTQYAARYCAIRRCIAYDNRLLDEHSDGIGSRYAIECIIEDNISFHNGDDNYDELGATRCIIRRNIAFRANPHNTPDGDGNGMKIGVRGGLDNLVYQNILFDNPRAGIDMADTERAAVFNNTCYNNGWFGLWLEAVRATVGGARVLNNICNQSGQGDIGALPACSVVELDYNCVSDNNNHNWARPAGPHGLVGMTAGFADPQLVISTEFAPGLSIPEKLAFLREQVYSKLHLKPECLCVDSGVEIPGVTEGYLGRGPDRGGFESH